LIPENVGVSPATYFNAPGQRDTKMSLFRRIRGSGAAAPDAVHHGVWWKLGRLVSGALIPDS
jgi:hypothetical protein